MSAKKEYNAAKKEASGLTGLDIYVLAGAILWEGENEDTDSKKFTVQFLNHLLPETLGAENSLRTRDGMEKLATAPVMVTLEQEVPYHDVLCRTALVYGLCWHFFENVGETYQSELYRQLFIGALGEYSAGNWETLPSL